MRRILASDLWAAARGLSMFTMDEKGLRALIASHEPLAGTMFASAVIVKAARQAITVRTVLAGAKP